MSDSARGHTSDGTSDGNKTFTEELLGAPLLAHPWVQRLQQWQPRYRTAVLIALLGGLFLIPYAGAVGLWDCWETHYGEVARSMIQRNDYVYPYWENAFFFSKPVLTLWIMALGMLVVGTNTAEGALGLYTEWGMRIPFVLLSILAAAMLAHAVSRVVSRRAGLATGFILLTMPLYFLLARQAVTDTPFVTTLICAMACAIIGQLDETTQHRAAWWYAFWVFCGLSTLAKGLLGIGVPAVVLVLYAALSVMDWSKEGLEAHLDWLMEGSVRQRVREGKLPMPVLWGQLYKMKFGTGLLVFAAVAFPWYTTMILFDRVDDEQKLFWYRFFIHDHLNRLGAGVHTTTPGGSFTYFIEQAGFAMFPWVALLPGIFALLGKVRFRSSRAFDHLAVLSMLWAAFTFTLLGLSATKFHHYIFPVLPPVAILCALFVDRLWEEGISEYAVVLVLGLALFLLVGSDLANNPKNFTDLFVYNYDRPYPTKLVTNPIKLANGRTLYSGNVLTLLVLAVGGYFTWDAFAEKARSTPYRVFAVAVLFVGILLAAVVQSQSPSALGAALIAGVAAVGGVIAFELFGRKNLAPILGIAVVSAAVVGFALKDLPAVQEALSQQFSRMSPTLFQPLNIKSGLGFAFALGGGLAVIGLIQRSRPLAFGSLWAFAVVFTLWFNWSHWVDLSHHWTQRDLFWRYYNGRKPGEPIAAYLMNWRGETMYSKNTVKQIKDAGRMLAFANQPGREWALVEHDRLRLLRQAVRVEGGPDRVVTPVTHEETNNKFVLVTID